MGSKMQQRDSNLIVLLIKCLLTSYNKINVECMR